MRLGVDLSILNQKGTPAFYSDIFANRPAFGYAGRVFISTDTGAIYEDTGSAWVLIADAGAGTTGTLQQVTTNGNTTTQGLVVTAGNVAIGTATAGAPLDIHSTGTNAQFNGTGTNNAYVFFQNAGTSKWRLGNFYNAGANSFDIHDVASATTRISVRNTGEVLITGYETISNTPTFSSAGNYASNPSLSLTIPASSTFNSGSSYAGMAASLLNTWQGNNTINSGAVMAGFIGVNRQSFSAAGYTETLTQGSAGIRAICGMQVLQQTGGSFSGTISHGASLLVQGVYPTSGANITYTNYFGLLINQLDEYGGVTFTNRWGIYQGGASDKNYLGGNTGIGISPQFTLAGFKSLEISDIGLIYAGSGQMAFNNNGYNDGTWKYKTTNYSNNLTTDSGQYVFYTAPSGTAGSAITYTERMRLTNTGFVGIGTTSPQRQFVVSNGGAQGIELSTASTYTSILSYNRNTSTYLPLQIGEGASNVLIGSSTDNGIKLQVTGTSYFSTNVGIGNNNPTAGLDVQYGSSSANISFRVRKADTITTFYVRGDGYVFAPSVYYFTTGSAANMFIDTDGSFLRSTSSLKYKTDVRNYDKGLNELMQIRSVYYKGISEKDGNKQFAGFIAEEIDELGLTEFVQYAEDGTPDALNYQNMVALLTKSIQELNDKLVRNNIN